MLRNKCLHAKQAVTASLVDCECFYTIYSSQLNVNQFPNRIGYFEDLSQYCGLFFNHSENVKPSISTVPGESLFDWPLYIEQSERANIRGCSTFKEKQLAVVGYFLEMCYDICLSPKHNISNNPGFESIIKVFDNWTTA